MLPSLLFSLLPFSSILLPSYFVLHFFHSGRKLQFSKLPAEVPVMFRVVELPLKHHICKVKSLSKGDANSEVTVYYQVTSAVQQVFLILTYSNINSFISCTLPSLSFHLVWPKALERTHTDGAVGGAFIYLRALIPSLCHSIFFN